jgi:hypothetical protein
MLITQVVMLKTKNLKLIKELPQFI